MFSLVKPKIDHDLVYQLSREKFRDKEYVDRLVDGEADVMAFGDEYDHLGVNGLLHTAPLSKGLPPKILEGDLTKLYSEGLLRRDSLARNLYEKLKLSSPYGTCPFCNHRDSHTLDHFLPKVTYEPYSVLPLNLIPCCRDCNSEKLAENEIDRSKQILHPYYDQVNDVSWLNCEIITTKGFAFGEYFITKQHIDDEMAGRLLCHLESLQLFDLYKIQSAREVNAIRQALVETFDEEGEQGVANSCLKQGRSRAKVSKNHWLAVLWSVAASDPVFCSMRWAGC